MPSTILLRIFVPGIDERRTVGMRTSDMVKKLIYNFKYSLVRPQAFAEFKRIMETQYWPLERLEALQEERRRNIVTHAFTHTAFYRKLYTDAGFELGDIGKDGWFEKLPTVTKSHMRDCFDDMCDPEQRKYLSYGRTGGSTGIPTKCGFDKRIPKEVFGWRMLSWFGVHPWDHHAYVWRQSRKTWWPKFKNAAIWWPTVHLKADASQLTLGDKLKFIERFNRLKPTLLEGYVGAITEISQLVLERGMKVHSPRMVWVTSAPLLPSYRKTIEAAFNAKVCDQYGSCEVGWFSQQCEECGGLHVNVEHVHLEFVDENNVAVPKGEYGRTLLTSLNDTAFPVIRYENGDYGNWLNEKCACGRSLPLMGQVKGRLTDTFILPSGKTLDGIYMTSLFDMDPDAVREFRATQHKDSSITFEYVLGTEGVEAVEKVHRAFEEHIKHEVPVRFVQVDEIPHDRGKLRFVVREK